MAQTNLIVGSQFITKLIDLLMYLINLLLNLQYNEIIRLDPYLCYMYQSHGEGQLHDSFMLHL